MTYITGDTHGYFQRYYEFTARMNPNPDDVMIILGDAALNYHGVERDSSRKYFVNSFPFTTFCIHGNHEMRPWDVPGMKTKEYCGGIVWFEEDYPKILYAKDGEIYDFDGLKCIVIGGAYSVDKYQRLARGWNWFENRGRFDYFVDNVEVLDKDFANVMRSNSNPQGHVIDTIYVVIDKSEVNKMLKK